MERIILDIEATINTNIKKVWDYYTNPEHIVNWNFASEDWHCPSAKNDLSVGGKFIARMEAKDNSFGFDFEAVYDVVIDNNIIKFTMSDNRKVSIYFSDLSNVTKLSISFEAETSNPIEMQREGWQAILNNFKRYVESK